MSTVLENIEKRMNSFNTLEELKADLHKNPDGLPDAVLSDIEKRISAFSSIAELKAEVRASLKHDKAHEENAGVKDRIINGIVRFAGYIAFEWRNKNLNDTKTEHR